MIKDKHKNQGHQENPINQGTDKSKYPPSKHGDFMELKEGYKKTEVGIIPKDWDVKLLDNAVDFRDGERRPIKSSERENMKGIYPYYGASGIIDYVNSYLFDGDYILLGEDGENILSRSTRLVFKITGKNWVNNHAHVLKPKNEFDIDFLTEYLESLNYEQYNSGTAQPKLNKNTCKNLPIIAPPKPEQQAIATALSEVDTLITHLDKLITKKKAIKQGAMQQLLKPPAQGGKRLPGFDGEWVETTIGEITNSYSGGTPNTSVSEYYNGNIPWISSSELNNQFVYETEDFISQKGLENSSAKMVNSGTVLVAMYGATAGVTAITFTDGAINQAVLAILPNSNISPYFLFYFFTKNKEEIIKTYTQGGQPNLSGSIIKSIELSIPRSLKEQEAIATILLDIDKDNESLEQKKSKYIRIKQGMMQELLTGKIRLNYDFKD